MEKSKRTLNPGLILLSSVLVILTGWLWDYLFEDVPIVSGWASQLFDLVVLGILPLFIVGLISCKVIGYAHSAFGSRATGTLLGILVFAFLDTAFILSFLRLINVLNDNMARDGYSSVILYSWNAFYAGGLPVSAVFFTILWVLSRTLNRSSAHTPCQGNL